MATTSPIKVPIIGKDELTKKLSEVQKRVGKFSKGLKTAGRAMTRYVSIPIGIAGVASMKFARDLNEGMANVATLIPGNLDRVRELKKGVQDLSVATGKSSEDIVEGLYETVSAFGDSAETMKRLEVATKAGVAGRATTIESLKLLSAVTKGYGKVNAQTLQDTSDLAFRVVQMGQTNFPELAAAIGRVVPLSEALDKNQKELFGTFATLTGVTGNAAEVSTQIASVYSAMMKPTGELTKAVKKMGFESATAMVKQIGFRQSLMKIEQATGGLKQTKKAVKELGYTSVKAMVKQLGFEQATEKLSGAMEGNTDKMAKMLKRKEALVAALALLGGQSDVYKEKVKAMEWELDGANDTMNASLAAYIEQTERINKTGQAWKETQAKLMRFAQRMGDKLLPIMERLFKMLEPLFKKLENMDDATLEWTLKIAGLAAAIGPLLHIFGTFAGSLGNIMGLMSKTKAGTMALSASITKMQGPMAATMSTASKLGAVLGSIGVVIGSLGVGYGLGTILSKAVIEPHSEEKAREFEQAQETRRKAEQALRYGTVEQRKQAIGQLQKAQAVDLPKSMISLENAAGQLASVFTGAQSPLERVEAESKKMTELQRKLSASIKESTRARGKGGETVTREITEERIKIDWGKPPPTVSVKRFQKSVAKTTDTGLVMEGV